MNYPDPPDGLSPEVVLGHLKNLEKIHASNPRGLRKLHALFSAEIMRKMFRLKNCSMQELLWLRDCVDTVAPVPWYRRIWRR